MSKAENTAEKAEIVQQVNPPLPPVPASDPEQFITLALQNNASIEVLERLMALRDRVQAQRNKEAFFETLVNFQRNVPAIKKTKQALFDGKEQYKYADLADVINTIKEPAAAAGIAYQWKIDDKPELITVSCHISAHGHTEITEMSAAPDPSGKKNAIQARGSAIEYMKRYTLAGALGLSISEDNDGGQLLMGEPTIEEIKEKTDGITAQHDLKAYYESLPKKFQTMPAVKTILKEREAAIKAAAKAGKEGKASGQK